MGEKFKTLAKGKLFDADFEIELNHPLAKGKDQQVHIQSSRFRVELNRKDYLKYALSILAAERKLKKLKKIK